MAARAGDARLNFSGMSIQANSIHKTFGDFTALAGVDLSVARGKLVALLGPSGSGKTTLLRITAGLEHPDAGSGRIFFDGEDVTALPAGKRRVGFVFQHYALFRHMTVEQNIAFGLTVRARRERPDAETTRARVRELLELVQLDGLAGRYPSQLSGGQRQRVALARALAVEPRVLLLDEPFGALDAKVRKELRRWLRQFHDQVQLTTVFVTHDQEEALEIADEVVIMNQARVEQVGTPQEVYDRPRSPFVYEFLGNVNVLDGRTMTAAGTGGTQAWRAGGKIYVRPHDIVLSAHDERATGMTAVVRAVHTAGPQARLTVEEVRTRGAIEVELSRAELRETGLQVGSLAKVRLRQARAFTDDYSI